MSHPRKLSTQQEERTISHFRICLHRILWCSCLTIAACSFIVGLAACTGNADDERKRWNASGTTVETDSFKNLVASIRIAASESSNDELPTRAASLDWRQPHVAVYSVPNIRAHHPRPTLLDLGDDGQAHVIDFLTKNIANEPRSWAKLREALMDSDDVSTGEKDPFQFERILVATVSKGADWDPGDRMVWTRVFVQPINFSFAGYTVAATENETVKVTSVEAASTRKLAADLDVSVPGLEGVKASLNPTDERTVKTTSDVTAQYEKLGIDIMRDFLRIVRESEKGGDAVGNTKVALSIVTDPSTIRKKTPRDVGKKPIGEEVVLLVTGTHLGDDGSPDPDKTRPPIVVLPQAPIPHCPLKARVWMLYERRLIDGGREYYDESKQTIHLLRDAEGKKDVEVVTADDVSPAVWLIQILPKPGNGTEESSEAKFLGAHVDTKGAHVDENTNEGHVDENMKFRDLVFTDYGQASKVAHWLRTNPGATVNNLKFNYPATASLVPFRKTHNECAEDYNPKNKGVYEGLPKQ
jgi:hypothetical protein